MANDGYDFLRDLDGSASLLEIMLGIEDLLDNVDLYGYSNWIKGEVIEGPQVSKYWVSVALKYYYDDMPDPRGIKRLGVYDIAVDFFKAKQEVYTVDDDTANQITSGNGPDRQMNNTTREVPEPTFQDIWIVTLKIPIKFVEDRFAGLDTIDDDDITAALSSGMSQEDAYKGDDTTEEELTDEE